MFGSRDASPAAYLHGRFTVRRYRSLHHVYSRCINAAAAVERRQQKRLAWPFGPQAVPFPGSCISEDAPRGRAITFSFVSHRFHDHWPPSMIPVASILGLAWSSTSLYRETDFGGGLVPIQWWPFLWDWRYWCCWLEGTDGGAGMRVLWNWSKLVALWYWEQEGLEAFWVPRA